MSTEVEEQPAHHAISIRIDNTVFELPTHHQTGATLKAIAGIPEAYQIFLETPGAEPDRQIRDDEAVDVHPGMKFYAVPAGTVG